MHKILIKTEFFLKMVFSKENPIAYDQIELNEHARQGRIEQRGHSSSQQSLEAQLR